MTDDWPMKSAQICFAISKRRGLLPKGSFLEHCSDGMVALTLWSHIRTALWVPFQAAARAVSPYRVIHTDPARLYSSA